MKKTFAFGIVLVLLLVCVGVVSANLVKNGGFESVNPVSNGWGWPLYPGSQVIAPWSIGGHSIDICYNTCWEPASDPFLLILQDTHQEQSVRIWIQRLVRNMISPLW